jgi:hypothetical protein
VDFLSLADLRDFLLLVDLRDHRRASCTRATPGAPPRLVPATARGDTGGGHDVNGMAPKQQHHHH